MIPWCDHEISSVAAAAENWMMIGTLMAMMKAQLTVLCTVDWKLHDYTDSVDAGMVDIVDAVQIDEAMKMLMRAFDWRRWQRRG